MLISIFVDLLWLFVYSPLRPIQWDTILALARKDQVCRSHRPLHARPGKRIDVHALSPISHLSRVPNANP